LTTLKEPAESRRSSGCNSGRKEDNATRLERIEVTIAVIEPAGAIEAPDHERDRQAAAVGEWSFAGRWRGA